MVNVKRMLFFLFTSIILTLFVACGEDNEEEVGEVEVNKSGFPIVGEEINMHVFANKPVQNEDNDWNDILIWNYYRDLTGVNVEWETIHPDALDERRNLALSGGETLPDAFFLAGISNTDLLKYGEDGAFIALNDLIDEYAPNLKKLMEENSDIRKGITFPDGNIYAMPSLIEEDFLSLRMSARPWIDTDYLNEFGMDIPETTDEFYEFLKTVKDHHPDMIPYGGTVIDEIVQWLSGSFGIMNRGPANTNFDLGVDGNVRFYATTDEYRNLLEYLHKLYSEELIDQTIFSIEWGQFTAAASEEQYASYVFYDPIDFFGEEIGASWDSLSALKGPDGHQEYTKVSTSIWDTAAFVITKDNKNPAAAVRWMDHFYSEDGAELYYMGVEGKTFEIVDGEKQYMDHIRNPEGDITFEQALAKELTWLGSINGIIMADYFIGGETQPLSMASAEKAEPYVPEEIWPAFTFTAEENRVLNSSGQDVAQFVEEMRDKFITGNESFDNWDQYLSELEKMGLDEVIEVYQNAYERYLDN